MFQYKKIHKNNGYYDLYDTQDDNVIYDINRNIADFTNLKSTETVFAYAYTDYASIFYKENNSLIYAVLDPDHLNSPDLSFAYPSDILFNERDLIVNNEDTQLMPRRLMPLRYMPLNFDPEELKYIPYIVDIISQTNKKIAILHNDSKHIRDYINFILHLFPISFAKKIGFITDISYVPSDLYDSVNQNVRIYGLNKTEDDCVGADVIINLNNPYDIAPTLTKYGEYLTYSQFNTRAIMQFNQELLKLYSGDGKINKELLDNSLPILLFERDANLPHALDLIDLYNRRNSKNIEDETFNRLTSIILGNNAYNEELAKKIDNIINNNPILDNYRIFYRERYVLGLCDKYKKIDKPQLDEIVEFFSNDLITMHDDLKTMFVKEKNKQSFYILYNLFKHSSNREKRQLLFDFLAVDRTWNVVVNNQTFEEFIYSQIKDSPDFIDQASLLLYSCCTNNNNTKDYAKNRINAFVDCMAKDNNLQRLLELITLIYDSIKNYLVNLNPNDFLDYVKYDLLTKDRIMSLIELPQNNKQKAYIELIDLINSGNTAAYPSLHTYIIDLIKSKDSKGIDYYKKFINVYNVAKFEEFFSSINESMSNEVISFIDSVKEEGSTSVELESYRLDFIYNTYVSLHQKTKKAIQECLGLRKNEDPETDLRNIIYNEEKVPEIAVKQKDAINLISTLSKKEDDIIVTNGVEGKISHSFSIALLGLLTSVVALVIFNIPVLIKYFLFNTDIVDTFFEINTIVMPIAFIYAYLAFVISYYVNIKISRNNVRQAIGKTFLNYLLLVILPFAIYSGCYILIYFIM